MFCFFNALKTIDLNQILAMHLRNQIIFKDFINILCFFGITATMNVSIVITPLGFFMS